MGNAKPHHTWCKSHQNFSADLGHSWLRTLSNHVFKSQIKFYPIFLLAENRQLNEMMVVALRKPFKRYQYCTGIYLTWYCQKMPKTLYLWLFMYYLVILSHFKQKKFEKFLPAIQAEKKSVWKGFPRVFHMTLGTKVLNSL